MTDKNLKDFRTIREAAETGFMTEAMIRWLIFSDKSFYEKCVRRVGRKVLIKMPDFYDYLDGKKESFGARKIKKKK